ncbi:MAG: FecR domain-containing protein, partial [Tannerellaceae bacterium]|nr:FecR domain-containing protein [Tannerellaceae bacterium]
YIRGFYTRHELPGQFGSLNDPEKRKEMKDGLDEFWHEVTGLDLAPTEEQTARYKEEARVLVSSLKKEERRSSYSFNYTFIRKWISYAAIVAVLVTTALTVYSLTKSGEVVTYRVVESGTGTHKRVVLPDGSKVLLNACSELTIPEKFVGEERRVTLKGEGFFEVVSNPAQPFVIETENMKINVLGTAFNVKAYREDEIASVCVQHGKVQVELPEGMVRLVVDQQVVLDKVTTEFVKQQELATRVLAWCKGGLYFSRTPLQTAVNDLCRMYGKSIELDENVNENFRIYGEHDNSSLEAVLNSICYTAGLNYQYKGEKIVIYNR